MMRDKVADLSNLYNVIEDPTGTLVGDFMVHEVATACKSLPSNKASGYDGITYEFFKIWRICSL